MRTTTLWIHQWPGQSLVCITETSTITTSATTTTATPGPVMATVSPSVSVPVATPAQESVAGPPCSFSRGSFSQHGMLIGILIYFGVVHVKGASDCYWSTATLFHGLWARSFMPRLRFRALMALLHVVDPLNEPAGNKLYIRFWVLLIF